MFKGIPPAYIDTASDERWNRVLARCPVNSRVTINPNSGPGTAPDPGWARRAAQLRAAGHEVYGYTHASRGARAGELVGDIGRYSRFYGNDVTGIFIDEMPATPDQVTSEQLDEIAAAILFGRRMTNPRRDSMQAQRIIGNPGVVPHPAIVTALPVVGIWIVHEAKDPNGASIDDIGRPYDLGYLDTDRQAFLAYGDPDPDRTLARLAELGWSYGWSTSDAGPLDNPWDENPLT